VNKRWKVQCALQLTHILHGFVARWHFEIVPWVRVKFIKLEVLSPLLYSLISFRRLMLVPWFVFLMWSVFSFLQERSVSLPLQKFVRLPHYSYQLRDIINHYFRVSSSGITSTKVSLFIIICLEFSIWNIETAFGILCLRGVLGTYNTLFHFLRSFISTLSGREYTARWCPSLECYVMAAIYCVTWPLQLSRWGSLTHYLTEHIADLLKHWAAWHNRGSCRLTTRRPNSLFVPFMILSLYSF
jgi:hypothetical protein